MSEKPLLYYIEIADRRFELQRISGLEQISRASRFELSFLVPHDDLEPDDIIRERATIVLVRESEVRRIEAIITGVELSARQEAVPLMELVLEHRVALLQHRRDIRIHRHLSAPEIVREVCEALGVNVRLRLKESYDKRPYCVQFRESDFDYCNRLLEDEGIFYLCRNDDTIVLGDSKAAFDDLPLDRQLRYRAASQLEDEDDFVFDVGSRACMTAGEVTLRDWNPEHPSLDMDVNAPVELLAGGKGEHSGGPEFYDYPGEYLEPGEGRRKARVAAEAFACDAGAFTGHTTCGRLMPGAVFELSDAPVGLDVRLFVAYRVRHDWERLARGMSSFFEAFRAEVDYRPPRLTYVPRILNPMTGFVTVPPNDEDDIHCNESGYVKVHFHWDRLQPYDDSCSHWIPVLQDNTGESSATPRNEWEVLVHFMEGDPDRPVVLGRVYNAEDPHSQPLPRNKAKSLLRSMGTPRRAVVANEIIMEDDAGNELITVNAQRDQQLVTANNKDEKIGTRRGCKVGNDESLTVGGNSTLTVGNDCKMTVANNQSWSIGGDRLKTVARTDENVVDCNHDLTIGGNHEREVGFNAATSSKSMQETIGGALIESFKVGHTTGSAKTLNLTIGGSVSETCGGRRSDSTTFSRYETIGGLSYLKAGHEFNQRAGEIRSSTVAGSLTASSARQMTFIGRNHVLMKAASMTHLGGAEIALKVGPTEVLLKDGLVHFSAPSNIYLNAGGPNNQAAALASKN